MIGAMPRLRYLILPVGIAAIAAIYWFLSYDPAGSVMLAVFALAMAVVVLILLPTINDVGPTAPVDANWHERE
jgi:hypothetical protein